MNHWCTTALPGIFSRRVDGEGSKFHIEKVQDVGPILERNRERRLSRENDKGWLRHAAAIPMIVHLQWLNEGFDCQDPNDRPELMRRLNSPEWRYLRTSNGALRVNNDWRPI